MRMSGERKTKESPVRIRGHGIMNTRGVTCGWKEGHLFLEAISNGGVKVKFHLSDSSGNRATIFLVN